MKSRVWDEFTKYKEENGMDRAVCSICGKEFDGSSKKGTTHLKNHLERCRAKRRVAMDEDKSIEPRDSVIDLEDKLIESRDYVIDLKDKSIEPRDSMIDLIKTALMRREILLSIGIHQYLIPDKKIFFKSTKKRR